MPASTYLAHSHIHFGILELALYWPPPHGASWVGLGFFLKHPQSPTIALCLCTMVGSVLAVTREEEAGPAPKRTLLGARVQFGGGRELA